MKKFEHLIFVFQELCYDLKLKYVKTLMEFKSLRLTCFRDQIVATLSLASLEIQIKHKVLFHLFPNFILFPSVQCDVKSFSVNPLCEDLFRCY